MTITQRTACGLFLLAAFHALPAAAAAPAVVERCAGQEAYATASRPVPAERKAAALLPPKLGAFVREDVAAETMVRSDEDLNVTYRNGGSEIFVGVSIPGSLADRQEAVRVTRQEAVADKSIDRQGEQICLGKDMSFYKLKGFYAWTRGDYFFYAQAKDPKALDAFMAAFPY